MKRRIGIVIPALLLVAGMAVLLTGCKQKEEVYKPDKFLVGNEGGKTEYQDVPTEVSELSFTFYSDMMPEEYTFKRNGDTTSFAGSFWGRENGPADIDKSYMEKIDKWVDDYNIRTWDGFSMTNSSVLDGGGFNIEITLGTGESIYASGSNAYPDNYREAEAVLKELIDAAIDEAGFSMEPDVDAEYKHSNAETFTDKMFDDFATEEWQKAYRDLLNETLITEGKPGYDEYLLQGYALYDINKDDVPELIIKSGTCEADYVTKVYYYDGSKAVEAGEVSGGHTDYYTYPDGNGILAYNAHMAYAAIYLIDFDGKKVSSPGEIIFEDDLYERMQADPDADYTPVNKIVADSTRIELAPLSFSYGLLEYQGPLFASYSSDMNDGTFKSFVEEILDGSGNFYAVNSEVIFNEDIKKFDGELSMADLYKKGGLFDAEVGEINLLNTYYDDFDGDGKKECLATFTEDEYYNLTAILFDYQNGRIYGYITNPLMRGDLEVVNSRIYVCQDFDSCKELEFHYYLNQAKAYYKDTDRTVLSRNAKESLERFRQDVVTDGGELAVAFLGCAGSYSGKMLDEVLVETGEAYADEEFMAELFRLKAIKQPGEEVYLLVPANANYAITVYEMVWGDDTEDGIPKRGEVLYRAEAGEMVVVRGNESDIVSNISISMDMYGKEFEYQPCLSLENGKLQKADKVVDFTRYVEE